MAVDAAVAGRARARAWTFARAVPVWGWLAGLVVVSTGIRYVFTRHAVAPWIMVDELVYSELAKSFAATGHFLVRGHTTGSYGYVYPVLISPAWAAFRSVPDAYAAAKGINSLVMSLAAIPAYFLARRMLGPWLSLAAAAFAVAIPSLVYTATLMTENAFYPIFLTAVLAFVAWLDRPTPTRTAVLIAACLVAYLTRAQAIALLPAILTAPLLVTGREAFRRYRLMYGLVAVGVLLVVAEQVARGRSVFGIFGAYQVTSTSHYSVSEVTKWFLYHVSELDLSLGVLPFAALLVLSFGVRTLPRPEKVFVAAAVAVSFWLVLEVAAFVSAQSFRVEERNMFYVVPLFLIALLVWIKRGLPRGTAAATAAIVVAAALPGALPYSSFVGLNAVSDTIALLPLGTLVQDGLGLDDVGLVVVFACAAAGLLLLLVPRRYRLVLPALVLAYFAVSQRAIEGQHHQASLQALFGGISSPPLHLDWIDRKVGSGADVAVIWTGNTDKYTIWENEFFNRSVRTFYRTGAPLPGDLPETLVAVDSRTGLVTLPGGRPISVRYALTDGSLALRGRVLEQDNRTGLALYRIGGQLVQASRVDGLWPQDTWSRRVVTYTRFECSGGTLAVAMQSDPSLFSGPNTVVASEGGRVVGRVTVPRVGVKVLRVGLVPVARQCVVRFTVERVVIPAVVFGSANTDTRALGAHFNRFTYRPS